MCINCISIPQYRNRISLNDLGLSMHILNKLRQANINSVETLTNLTERDLRNIRFIGRSAVNLIRFGLSQFDLILKQ